MKKFGPAQKNTGKPIKVDRGMTVNAIYQSGKTEIISHSDHINWVALLDHPDIVEYQIEFREKEDLGDGVTGDIEPENIEWNGWVPWDCNMSIPISIPEDNYIQIQTTKISRDEAEVSRPIKCKYAGWSNTIYYRTQKRNEWVRRLWLKPHIESILYGSCLEPGYHEVEIVAKKEGDMIWWSIEAIK